jgi:hypothetical protein
MNRLFSFLRRLHRLPDWLYWRVRNNIVPIPRAIRLAWHNRRKTTPIANLGGPVVSLTTYGARIRTVYLVIESIAMGTLLPSRVILWVDDENLFNHLPRTIRRLMHRGLEVKLCPNYGPHTKYYPYIATEDRFDVALVTADDDQLYPKQWLEGLAAAFRDEPAVVNCYQCRAISVQGNSVSPYRQWQETNAKDASFRQVALGVWGVIYPPAFLRVLKNTGAAFKNCCPTADDLWLHVQALRAGYKVRQITAGPAVPLAIPGTEGMGLWRSNYSGGNDRQIAATYTRDDISKLLAFQD